MFNRTAKSWFVVTTRTAVRNLRRSTFKILLIPWKDIREWKKRVLCPGRKNSISWLGEGSGEEQQQQVPLTLISKFWDHQGLLQHLCEPSGHRQPVQPYPAPPEESWALVQSIGCCWRVSFHPTYISHPHTSRVPAHRGRLAVRLVRQWQRSS